MLKGAFYEATNDVVQQCCCYTGRIEVISPGTCRLRRQFLTEEMRRRSGLPGICRRHLDDSME